ncbi:hypothetical protein [Mycoplasma marinum]|uniref:hypothetical protein n=1 Tax=Mycoplasma marinum TaxID=1937190 RepID=UPI00103B71B9|nr:hypothetical protein [Mycoplasma marinum]
MIILLDTKIINSNIHATITTIPIQFLHPNARKITFRAIILKYMPTFLKRVLNRQNKAPINSNIPLDIQ